MNIKNSPDNVERIKKEAIEERGLRDNRLKQRLHELVQSDEQKAINRYSEGFCYGCNKTDQIISTLVFGCAKCRKARGKEALLATVYRKPIEELCDFCGHYKQYVNQINVSLCKTCMGRIHILHQEYRKSGGAINLSPFYKSLKRKQGKDWAILNGFLPDRKL